MFNQIVNYIYGKTKELLGMIDFCYIFEISNDKIVEIGMEYNSAFYIIGTVDDILFELKGTKEKFLTLSSDNCMPVYFYSEDNKIKCKCFKNCKEPKVVKYKIITRFN